MLARDVGFESKMGPKIELKRMQKVVPKCNPKMITKNVNLRAGLGGMKGQKHALVAAWLPFCNGLLTD